MHQEVSKKRSLKLESYKIQLLPILEVVVEHLYWMQYKPNSMLLLCKLTLRALIQMFEVSYLMLR